MEVNRHASVSRCPLGQPPNLCPNSRANKILSSATMLLLPVAFGAQTAATEIAVQAAPAVAQYTSALVEILMNCESGESQEKAR